MKKVELHLHLDGSISPQYASELVGHDCTPAMIGSGSSSLKDYLGRFELPIDLLQDEENLEQFSYLLAKELEKDEVIYAEVRFCPLFHVEKLSVGEVVGAILRGFQKVSTVSVNLIFCMMRHFSVEKNIQIIELTKQYLGNGVVGIDLAGDEAHFPTEKFQGLFELIRQVNIPFTIHAGEADSYLSVEKAIEFGAKRIGHGISSVFSPETMEKLRQRQILLEVCPTSNLDTHVVDSMVHHPIQKLVAAGVPVCINTDNRTVSNTNLGQEYQRLKEAFAFTDDQFLQFNLQAIDASFLTEREKEEFKKRLLRDG